MSISDNLQPKTVSLSAVERAKARLLEIKQQQEAKRQAQADSINANRNVIVPRLEGWKIDNSVNWNEEQQSAIHMGLARKSFCLIGAAGTGKTTTLKGVIRSLMNNNLIEPLNDSTKWLQMGDPGIVLTSFTNMAVRQIAKHFSRDVKCITLHKLLEFAPVWYEIEDPESGEPKKTMRFEPSKNSGNKLPNLQVVVVDESSMVETGLFDMLIDALPNPEQVQFIFLGDLNQLPPVFGGPILGKKLMNLPIVELTQVYRQALLSPIINLAIQMKEGKIIPTPEGKQVIDKEEHGKLIIHPWGKSLTWEDALDKAGNFAKAAIRERELDPYQDIILCPFNVNFGVIELNARIADFLGRERGAKVYEVIAGFNHHYFAVGDKVLCNKREALIESIEVNREYSGDKLPADPDRFIIDRWGGTKLRENLAPVDANLQAEKFDVDAFLSSVDMTEVENRSFQASHKIVVKFIDSHLSEEQQLEFEEKFPDLVERQTIQGSKGINDLIFGYAITVHKSQGSEWRRVFIMTHNTHLKMCSRELMYTAITRAREYLYIICEPDRGVRNGTLSAAAKKPKLAGVTLEEKLVSLSKQFQLQESAAAIRAAAPVGKRILEEEDDV